MTNLEKLLAELETGLDGLNLPWHIGHISEEDYHFADVEDCDGNMIAENALVPNFICNAPSRIKKLIEIIRVQNEAINRVTWLHDDLKDEDTKERISKNYFEAIIHLEVTKDKVEAIAKGLE